MIINVNYPKPETVLFKDLPEGAWFVYPPIEGEEICIKLSNDKVYENAIALAEYNTFYRALPDEEVIPLQPCGEFNFKILEQ